MACNKLIFIISRHDRGGKDIIYLVVVRGIICFKNDVEALHYSLIALVDRVVDDVAVGFVGYIVGFEVVSCKSRKGSAAKGDVRQVVRDLGLYRLGSSFVGATCSCGVVLCAVLTPAGSLGQNDCAQQYSR